jgi:hypothetical protein
LQQIVSGEREKEGETDYIEVQSVFSLRKKIIYRRRRKEAEAEDGFIVLFYNRFVSWEQSIRV